MQSSELAAVGMSHLSNADAAAAQAVTQAQSGLKSGSKAAWAIAFSGNKHDPVPILKAIRSRLQNIPVYGGSCAGTIVNDSLGYGGFECSVALFDSSIGMPQVFIADDLQAGEFDAGKSLGARLQSQTSDENAVILLYDSVKSSPPPVLHMGSALLDGI